MTSSHPFPVPSGTGRQRFVAELAARRAASGKSFAALAREIDHPRSTLHGWCRGDHLPFPRDDETFARLLGAIGIDDPTPWIADLRRLRRAAGRQNPYPGLEAFTEDDAGRFHGRDALVARLLAEVGDREATEPLIVIGASGAGKTSLLRAGLLGSLRRDPAHTALYFTPGSDPAAALGEACERLDRVDGATTVIVDQFEELFTVSGADAVHPTIEALVRLQGDPTISVVLGVRADFFHQLAAVPALLTALDRRQVVVGPMSTREVAAAIVAPATDVGLTVAPELLAHLLSEFDAHTQRSATALPLLSHVLYQLVEDATTDELRLADYEAIGGLADALRRTADDALASLPARLHTTCRNLFLQLVELRSDTTPTRRGLQWSALDRFGDEHDARTVLDAFVERRLLTAGREYIALSHEALLTAWPVLQDWVDAQRDGLLVRRRVRSAYRSWRETGQPADGLLRGSLLDEALQLLDGPLRATLEGDEQTFVTESGDAREASRARDAEVLSRQVALQSDLLGVSDPSLSGQLALVAAEIAETPEARSAVLRSAVAPPGPRFLGPVGPTTVATDPHRGTAAAGYFANGRTERFDLVDGLPTRSPGRAVEVERVHALALGGHRLAIASRLGAVVVIEGDRTVALTRSGEMFDGPVYAIEISPDGDRVVAAGAAPGVLAWREVDQHWCLDLRSERHSLTMGLAVRWSDGIIATASNDGVVSLSGRDGEVLWAAEVGPGAPVASTVRFSPDGTTLAAGYHDGNVLVWELDDPTAPVRRPLGSAAFATWVNGVDFSPDGRLLIAASSDGTVRLWDTTTWREVRRQLRHPSVVSGARFLTDRWILTSSEDGIVRSWDVGGAVSGSDASIWAAAFDDAGDTFVTASRMTLSIDHRAEHGWTRTDLPAPRELRLFSGVCDISADGRLVVAGTRSGAVLLVETTSGTEIGSLHGDLDQLVEAVVISDRTVTAVDSGGRVQCWHLDECGGVRATASRGVSPGTALGVADLGAAVVAVTTEPGEVVLLDTSRPGVIDEVTRFRTGEAFPICAARRAGHAMLATGGADRAVSIWSIDHLDRPELLQRVVGPAGHVMALDIDRTGRLLAAGTTDGRIWIWEWVDDSLVWWATIESGEAGVYAVRFSPDGRYLVSAGPEHRVTWWTLDPVDAAAAVRKRVGDPLTDAERARLLPQRS